jgi:Arc/MetJ-type ribon-helix-helix transcriptional regulator
MADQITVRLTPALRRSLDRASKQLRRKNSDVVRLALEQYLASDETGTATPPADRVRSLLGSVQSGVSDLAERHREYLLETLKRGR